MDETWLYHIARRQSNNQWSGGMATHRTPKNSECKNPMEKYSPRFFGIKTASSSFIIFQRAKISTRSITHLCWINWTTFWRKTRRRKVTKGGPVLARQCPVSPGTCNPEATALPGLPVSWSPTLFTGSDPSRTTTCSLHRRKQLQFSFCDRATALIYILQTQLFALRYTLKHSRIKINLFISTPTCFGLIRPSSGSCRA